MLIYGKLTPGGVLTDIGYRDPRTWGDGSTDVLLMTAPTVFGPFGYDAVNKVAIPNPAQAAVELQAQQAQSLAAIQWHDMRLYVPVDVVATLATFSDIPGMSFPVGINDTWIAEAKLFCLGAAAGLRFQITGPASPIRAVIGFDGHTTAKNVAKTFDPKASPAYGVPSMAYINNAVPFTGLIKVYMQIANGPNAGTVKLQFASITGGQTTKVLAGSFGMARRAT